MVSNGLSEECHSSDHGNNFNYPLSVLLYTSNNLEIQGANSVHQDHKAQCLKQLLM